MRLPGFEDKALNMLHPVEGQGPEPPVKSIWYW